MASITLKVNGNQVLSEDKYEKTRVALLGIMTTQNIDSKTVKTSLEFLGGLKYADAFGKAGKPADVVEVYEGETLSARGTRSNVAQRMADALNSAKRAVEIFTVKKDKSADSETQEIGVA